MNEVSTVSKVGISLNRDESNYLRGARQPVAGSLLMSTSKYLNHPAFRDLYAQQGLRRLGQDVPSAYLVPDIMKAIDETTDYTEYKAQIAAARERLPDFADWLDARFAPNTVPEDVKDCAPGTLGARVYDFMAASGLKMDFMFLSAPKTDLEYLNKRRAQTHDIQHMVTGLDTSPVGEVALVVANTIADSRYLGDDKMLTNFSMNGLFVAVSGLMRSVCHYPETIPVMLEGYARGYALGSKQKRPLFMTNWETYYGWKIEDIREEFSFEDGPADGQWQWTFNAVKDPE